MKAPYRYDQAPYRYANFTIFLLFWTPNENVILYCENHCF